MNRMEMMLELPVVQVLGWSLLHFIWQGGLVGILLFTARILLRQCAASARYLFACAAMLVMLMFPVATAWVISVSSPAAEVIEAAATPVVYLESGDLAHRFDAQLQVPSQVSGRLLWQKSLRERVDPLLPWITGSWLTGVLLLSFRLWGGWIYTRHLADRGNRPMAAKWQESFRSVRERVRVRASVGLVESTLIQVPTVIGWLRPVILLPTSSLTGLTAQQLEVVLAHELAHIRRHDYLVNLLQTVIETLLFYHPAVWWVSRQVRLEREHCCDDVAMAVCPDPLTYARALAKLEEVRSIPPQLAMAASGGSLLKRIQHIVGCRQQDSHGSVSWLAGLMAIAAVSILLAGALAAFSFLDSQTPKAPRTQEGRTSANPNPAAEYTGQWLIEYKPGTDFVHLSVRYRTARGGTSDNSYSVPLEQLQGFSPSQAMASGSVVKFQVKRDAGTFNCEGWFKNGQGAGHFEFSPNPGFAAELRKRGYGAPSAEQQFSMAMHDVSLALIEELRAQGYERPPIDQLVSLGTHGVRLEYVSGLKALGYKLQSVGRLIEMRDHGVSLDFIRELQALGYKQLAADEIIRTRDHGVDPEFIKELRALGYNGLSLDQIINLGDHGASPEFVNPSTIGLWPSCG